MQYFWDENMLAVQAMMHTPTNYFCELDYWKLRERAHYCKSQDSKIDFDTDLNLCVSEGSRWPPN